MNEDRPQPFDTVFGVVAAWSVVAFAATTLPLRNWDYWFHLTVGRLVAFHHAIPNTNLFGFAAPADTPLLLPGWLGDVWLHQLHEVGGLVATLAARNLCALAAWGMLAWCMWKLTDGHARVTALIVGVGGLSFLAVAGFAGPQMFAWPIFAALCVLCVASLDRRLVRLSLPLAAAGASAFWANAATGFWVPAALLLAFAAVARHRKQSVGAYLLGAAAAVLGIFATPAGAAILPATLDSTGLQAWLILGGAVALAPAFHAIPRPTRGRPKPVVWAASLTLAGVALAAQPWTQDHWRIPAAVFGERVRQMPPLRGYAPSNTPVEAVEFLRTRGGQPRVLAAPHLSGYLLYELQEPGRPLPIVWGIPDRGLDAAVTVPRAKLLSDVEVMRGLLHQLRVEAVVVTPDMTQLAAQLEQTPQWNKVGTWGTASVYLRDPTQ